MKEVFKYMGWCEKRLGCTECLHHKDECEFIDKYTFDLDGNDMVEAINKMVEAAGVEPDAIRASIGLELCLTLI